MTSKEIKRLRCLAALKVLMADNNAVFLTLTTPDVVTFDEIRHRWRLLRHDLLRALRSTGGVEYVMNYELHPQGHGWHIHAVFSRFIPLSKFLPMIRSFGFGRTNVKRVSSEGVYEYLLKHALKAYRGVSSVDNGVLRQRLINASRGLPALSEWAYNSPHLESKRNISRNCLVRDFSWRRAVLIDIAASFGFQSVSGVRDFFDLYFQHSQKCENSQK